MTRYVPWHHRIGEPPQSTEYTYRDIPLDLKPAVTLVASMSAQFTPMTEPKAPTSANGWHERHFPELFWHVQDSFDGEHWANVVYGGLFSGFEVETKRFASPLGEIARVAWKLAPMIQLVTRDASQRQTATVCEGRSCGVRHADLKAVNVEFRLAIRTF